MISITKDVNENVSKASEIMENIEVELNKANDNIETVGKKFKTVTQKANQAENKVNGIYSEFVGILGVFTALSFALMGSVQVFGNILKNIDTPTMGNIGYVLIVGGIYLILIYLIIMTLFIGMKKVFDNKNSKYKFNWIFTLCIVTVSITLIILGIRLV